MPSASVSGANRFIAAVAVMASCAPFSATARGIDVGKPAPDFQARTFDGHDIRLADFKGHVLIINLWATWCEPCRQELPLLNSYHELRKSAGLDVIALATEDSIPADQLKPLAAVASFPFVRRLRGAYEIMGGVPTNYVIDRNGIVRYASAGGFTLDSLNALLVPLLNEKVSQPREAELP